MTKTINLTGYDPNTNPRFSRDESLLWPSEIHVDSQGRATACYDGQPDVEYADLDSCFDAHQLDADHVEEWLK